MSEITREMSVGEVARSFPASIAVFEEYGVDFCCGGKRPLGEACQDRGVSFGQLVEAIERLSAAHDKPEEAPSFTSLSQLIDYILARHHTYLRDEMPRLSARLAKVTAAHGERHGSTLFPLSKVFEALRRELEDHMWKEENILFPLIRGMEASGGAQARAGVAVSDPIRVMEFEHQSAGNALDQMRHLTGGYQTPPDGCGTYAALMEGLKTLESDLHQHIHLENNILFPKAIELEN